MDLSLNFGRFIAGALISALLAVGGVWFVVDLSLRGVESSIEVTNKRIDDLRVELVRHIDQRMELLEFKLTEEFQSTREAIKKAELLPKKTNEGGETPNMDPIRTASADIKVDIASVSPEEIVGSIFYWNGNDKQGKIDELLEKGDGTFDAFVVTLKSDDDQKRVAISPRYATLFKSSEDGSYYVLSSVSDKQISSVVEFDKASFNRRRNEMLISADTGSQN
ncbi:MAG: hypothetical protein KF914_09655 [Rhizobiaceae bacterium]|nr:hypothetical protein [Rhizobiaceae bacterium]